MRIIHFACTVLLAACTGGSQAPGSGRGPERVVQAFYDAFNRRDIEGVLAAYAPDAVFIEAPADTLMRGTGELRRFYRQQFQLFPRMRLEVRERRVQGRTVVDAILVRGGICGEPSPGVATFDVVDGRIRSLTEPPVKGEGSAVSVIPGVHVACPATPAL